MRRARAYAPVTVEAAQLLGARVRLARRERRWTLQELAERVGVTHVTMRKVERGDPTVALGVAFEAATVVGVPLFHEDRSRRSLEAARVDDRLAVLPQLVRKPAAVDDDF
jgi:transcriptional regulator with XRE-family HTH domain